VAKLVRYDGSKLELVCDDRMRKVDCRTGTYHGHIYRALANMSCEDQCVFVSVVGLQVPGNVIRGSGTRLVAAFQCGGAESASPANQLPSA
jgi:hypothetical protein